MQQDFQAGHHVRDVVIIGAGIVGVAAAYELAQRGVKATVVERCGVASAQSGRNWGFVRQQGRSMAELPLMMAANRRWQGLSDELDADIGWCQGGNLAIAVSEPAAERYRKWLAESQAHGMKSVAVGDAEIAELVPGLRHPYRAAIYAASDGYADPVAATTAYAQAAERLGAEVVVGRDVRAIVTASGKITGVQTDSGVIRAGQVVCAAGAWTRHLLRGVGVQIPQGAVRSTVCLTAPLPPITRSTFWGPWFAFRQRPDGRVVLSDGVDGDIDVTADLCRQAFRFLPAVRHNWRDLRVHFNKSLVADPLLDPRGDRAYEPDPNRRRVASSVKRFSEALPAVGEVVVEKAWAGLIDATPDMSPIIDHVDQIQGLVVATGLSGHGFGLGPVMGEIVADLVEGKDSAFDVDSFRLCRFRDGAAKPVDAIM